MGRVSKNKIVSSRYALAVCLILSGCGGAMQSQMNNSESSVLGDSSTTQGANLDTKPSCNFTEIESHSPASVSVTVSSETELKAALASAVAGQLILLNPASYGLLNLYSARETYSKFPGMVTLKSADPLQPAIFSGFQLAGVENLTFDSIKFKYTAKSTDPGWADPFSIGGSKHIAIRNSIFEGDLMQGSADTAANGYGTGIALTIYGSSYITISNNRISTWLRGIVVGDSNHFLIQGNDISDLRSDGADFAQVTEGQIVNNHIHDFRTSPSSGDHPDMIQFWTSGTTLPSKNIQIRCNFLNSAGGNESQSIFMRNEVVDQGSAGSEMFYQNILIEHNVIHNAHLHGITVGETNGLIIRNNTILFNKDTAESAATVYIPTINSAASSLGVTIATNIVPRLGLTSTAQLNVINNLTVQRDFPTRSAYYGELFVNGLAGRYVKSLYDLKAIPGSLIETQNVGSILSRMDFNSKNAIGYIADISGQGFSVATHSFNVVSNSNVGQIKWKFGDGSTSSATIGTHTYTSPGTYNVEATANLLSGGVLVLKRTISVKTATFLDLPFNSNSLDTSLYLRQPIVTGPVTYEAGVSTSAIRLNGGLVEYETAPEMIYNSEYTVMAHFKKDAGAEASSGGLLTMSGSFVIFIGENGVSAAVNTSKSENGFWLKADGVGINDSDWHKITLTYSGIAGTAILYIDGSEVARGSDLQGTTQIGNMAQPFYVGYPYGQRFPGLIDNVKFLGGAMSPAQVQAN